ncbi:ABC transporter ATP-binding protein [Halovivax cerinus]|uniref:ABC transporter ATP-binding protein n=1 Tax=Halovivax cerinus TaxID=1487865 RepID=A0ABD5NRD9_9EURY|nr:oligopeptide/dipeptide ABC transporter ATP-binding protein [Halovivax cerinus]
MSENVSADATRESTESSPLVQVRDLTKHYPIHGGILKRQTGAVRAVNGVSFDIEAGETFAIVGESGCGKTTLGKTVARLLEPTSGEIRFDGTDIAPLSKRQLKSHRKDIQVVYQDPSSSLNPRRRIGKIIAEPLVVHDIGTKAERRERVVEVMERVDLPEDFRHRYPNALSGGQQQRVAIARALVVNPKFVVLDEPTSALDVSVQAKFISLLEELQVELDITYLVISHNLSLVKNIADRIGVMYLGEFMEVTDSDRLFRDPLNPYTEQLLSAIPVVDSAESEYIPKKIDIEGEPPDPADPPAGCPFHPRCHRRVDACDEVHPDLVEEDPDHTVRCLLYEGDHDEEVLEYTTEEERTQRRTDAT